MHGIRKKIHRIDLLFLVFVSIFLTPRIIVSFTKSDYFNGDFAFYYFLTRDIIINHKFPLIGHVVGEIGGFTQGALWSYLLTIPFLIFNGDPIGGKFFMVFTSILTLFIGSFFSWKLFGKKEGILIAILLGTSPYLIKWTNIAWPPYIIPLISTFYLFSLFLFLSKKEKKYLYLAFASLGLFIHFEIASLALFFPSFLLLVLFLVFKKIINFNDLLKSTFIFMLFFIPHVLFDLSNNLYNLRGLLNLFPSSNSNSYIGFINILEDRLHLFKTDATALSLLSDYKILILILAYLVFGLLIYLKDKRIKFWKKIYISHLFISIPITFFGTFLIPVERASFWWFTYLTIFYIFFAGIILGFLLNKNLLQKIIIFLLFFFICFQFIKNLNAYFETKNTFSYKTHSIQIQEPIEFIYEDSKGKNFNVLYFTGGEKVIDFKYMFWFIGNKKYKSSNHLYSLDLNYISQGGTPEFINEKNQFANLTKDVHYIILKNSEKDNFKRKNYLANHNIKLLEEKDISNESDGFTVLKIKVD